MTNDIIFGLILLLVSFTAICFPFMLAASFWGSNVWRGIIRNCIFSLYVSFQALWWHWAHSGNIEACIGCPTWSFIAIQTWNIVGNTLSVFYPHWIRARAWTPVYIEISIIPFKLEEWKWYVFQSLMHVLF